MKKAYPSFIVFFLLGSIPSEGIDRLILVNGGYSPPSNYETHVENLLSFKNAFPGVPAKIFNASGPKALVVPFDSSGRFARNSRGQIEFKPRSIPGDVKPALKTDIKAGFQASKEAKDLFVYWGDHGNHSKISLWEATGLKPAETRSLYQLLPKTTRIRVFHDHCHGGSSMVDESRKVPEKLEGWNAYLNEYYPGNVCGLAGSGHDEVGEYIGWGKKAENSPWVSILSKEGLSLQSVKDDLVSLSLPTPRLTTDYLAEDLVRFFCGMRELSSHRGEEGGPNPRPLADETDCEGVTRSLEYAEVHEAFMKEAAIASETGWLIGSVRERFLQKTFPEKYAKYSTSIEKIEKLRGKVLLLKENKPTDTKEIKKIEEEILSLRTDDINAFEELEKNVERGYTHKAEWVKYFKEEGWNRTLEPDFKSGYKIFGAPGGIIPAFFDRDPTTIHVYAEADIKQKERQKVSIERQKARRQFVERKLNASEYKELKEFYEAIRKCETDPLR